MIHIEKEPFWVQEAFIALSREQDEDYRSIMSHPDKFGMTREETQEMFAPYLAYRDAVLPELMALLIQAGKLRRYVGSEGDKDRFRILEMTGTVLLNENDTEKLTCWKKLKKAEKERRMGSLLRLAWARRKRIWRTVLTRRRYGYGRWRRSWNCWILLMHRQN